MSKASRLVGASIGNFLSIQSGSGNFQNLQLFGWFDVWNIMYVAFLCFLLNCSVSGGVAAMMVFDIGILLPYLA